MIVTHGFLRSLARLDLADRESERSAGAGSVRACRAARSAEGAPEARVAVDRAQLGAVVAWR